LVTEPVELQCLGGFVISELYGLTRSTADIDVLVVNSKAAATLGTLAGPTSSLAAKHRVYIDLVPNAQLPDGYDDRLVAYEVTGLTKVRLLALERHDLALAKLTRNIDRDIEDIKKLALGPGLDTAELRRLYEKELRPYVGRPEREDLTLDLWVEMINELRQGR
jgi:hypothetical protein